MQVTASLNNLRIAPRKVRLVAHSIKGLPVQAALMRLKQEVQRSAEPMRVLLESAIANATNNFKLAKEGLYVAEVQVMDGLRLKRFTPKAFGSATPILKRSSKVRIILDERAVTPRETPKVAPKKKAVARKPVTKAATVEANKPAVTPETLTTT